MLFVGAIQLLKSKGISQMKTIRNSVDNDRRSNLKPLATRELEALRKYTACVGEGTAQRAFLEAGLSKVAFLKASAGLRVTAGTRLLVELFLEQRVQS